MRRMTIPLVMIVLASVFLFPVDVNAVGTPDIEVMIFQDHQGFDSGSAVNVSTGYFGTDILQTTVMEIEVLINGTVSVTNQYPQVRTIGIELGLYIINDGYGVIAVEHEPASLSFSGLAVDETRSMEFSILFMTSVDIPGGENSIEISGTWSHSPGMGGDIDPVYTPFHIEEVVAGGLSVVDDFIEVKQGDENGMEIEIQNSGNVYEPDLDFEILSEDGSIHDIETTIIIDQYLPGEYVYGILQVNFHAPISALPGDRTITIRMMDIENQRILDKVELIVEIVEVAKDIPDHDDDDEPHIEIELLDSALCERYYTDEEGDDIFAVGSVYNYEYEIGSRPQVDIKEVNVWRNGDELFIKAITGAKVEGWTFITVYVVPNGIPDQRNYYTEDFEKALFMEYEPSTVIASNDLFAKGSYWPVEVERNGNSITASGSLEDLMREGLDEDFEVFIQLIDLDPELMMMETIEDLVIEMVIDYGGYGAGKVIDGDPSDPVEPMLNLEIKDLGELAVKIGIGIVVIVVITFLVIFSIVMITRKKKKGKKKIVR